MIGADRVPDREKNVVVICGTLFSGFAAAHLIDEFVWGAPAEFHLSVEWALILALVFIVALVGLVTAAARATRASYLGLTIIGLLIAIADTLKHAMGILAPGRGAQGSSRRALRSGSRSLLF